MSAMTPLPRRRALHHTERMATPATSCIDYLNTRFGTVVPPPSVFDPPDPAVVNAELAMLAEGLPVAARPNSSGEFDNLAFLCRQVLLQREGGVTSFGAHPTLSVSPYALVHPTRNRGPVPLPPASTAHDLSAIRARTDVLARIHRLTEVTAAEAQDLTGMTYTKLAQLALEGVLQAHYTGKKYIKFDLARLLRLMRQRRIPFSLFDVVRTAAADGRHLTGDELTVDEVRTRARRDLQMRGAWCYRLLRRDHVVPTTPAWAAWYQGNTRLAQELLDQERQRYAVELAEFAARHLTLATLWIPALPLTSYGRYTLAALGQAHQAGQRVDVIGAGQVEHLEITAPLPEVTVYENAVVYVHVYTSLGRRDGAIRIDDPDLATHLYEQLRMLSGRANAFETFRQTVVA